MNKQEKQRALRRLLKSLGWNCADAAKYLGVNHVTVRMWHCGREPVPEMRLEQLKDKLEIR
jgi:hypothetical protein